MLTKPFPWLAPDFHEPDFAWGFGIFKHVKEEAFGLFGARRPDWSTRKSARQLVRPCQLEFHFSLSFFELLDPVWLDFERDEQGQLFRCHGLSVSVM